MLKKYNQYRYSAKSRGHTFSLSLNEFKSIIVDKECFYCGEAEKIGIDRIESNVGYEINNCVAACSTCNFIKQSMTQIQFVNQIRKIAEKTKDFKC